MGPVHLAPLPAMKSGLNLRRSCLRVVDRMANLFQRSVTSPVCEDVVAPFDLHDIAPHHGGACTLAPGGVTITTDPRSGGYSAFLPIAPLPPYEAAARFRCDLDLAQGRLGICALASDYSIIAERVADRRGIGHVDLVVPDMRRMAGIMFRNAMIDGSITKATVTSLIAARHSRDAIFRIKDERPKRRLDLPLRRYVDTAPASAAGDPTVAIVDVDVAETALIVIDAWDVPPDERDESPDYRHVVDHIRPLLNWAREVGMLVIHAPHDRPVHPAALPAGDEIVISGEIADADFIASQLRRAGLRNLLFAGYALNECMMMRTIGMIEMHKQGFRVVLVRDASLAKESPSSAPGQWAHKGMVQFIELSLGASVALADLQRAIRPSAR